MQQAQAEARAHGQEPISASREIPIHVDMVIDKNKTMPLAMPMKIAIGDVSGPSSKSAGASKQQNLNHTMPMAAARMPSMSGTPPIPSSSGRLQYETPSALQLPVSGVYSSPGDARAMAHAASMPSMPGPVPSHANPGNPAAHNPASHAPAKSHAWIWIVALIVLAVTGGGLAAWFLR
jgi:hypothetical protein